jgi:hypothetical protein
MNNYIPLMLWASKVGMLFYALNAASLLQLLDALATVSDIFSFIQCCYSCFSVNQSLSALVQLITSYGKGDRWVLIVLDSECLMLFSRFNLPRSQF